MFLVVGCQGANRRVCRFHSPHFGFTLSRPLCEQCHVSPFSAVGLISLLLSFLCSCLDKERRVCCLRLTFLQSHISQRFAVLSCYLMWIYCIMTSRLGNICSACCFFLSGNTIKSLSGFFFHSMYMFSVACGQKHQVSPVALLHLRNLC